ncbi:MAG TPA: hypothetical protein VGX68_03840 [Thermoanaerobaculia bacterium]|nr:hypothetical protein [Thermoanaerobaculia bacterium]
MEAWIAEIRAAQEDAAEAIPFGPLAGVEIEPEDLFHLAPNVALKFRGLAPSRRNIARATDAALASYVATTSQSPDLVRFPTICFAFAYLASHYGLGLMSEPQVDEIMAYITDNPEALLAPVLEAKLVVALEEEPEEMAAEDWERLRARVRQEATGKRK